MPTDDTSMMEREVDGYLFHIIGSKESICSSSPGLDVRSSFDAWRFAIIADAVLKDCKNPANLITGVQISFVRNTDDRPASGARNAPRSGLEIAGLVESPPAREIGDQFIVNYKLVSNTTSQYQLEDHVRAYPAFRKFATAGQLGNIDMGQYVADFYRGLYPDFPVFRYDNTVLHPVTSLYIDQARVNLLDDTSREAAIAPFYSFIEFIGEGTLFADPEVGKALASAIRQCIPDLTKVCLEEKEQLESGNRPNHLPKDHLPPASRRIELPGK